jgi:molybdate transport system substrate-binding protein
MKLRSRTLLVRVAICVVKGIMKIRASWFSLRKIALGAFLALLAASAAADEIKVLSAGAVRPVLAEAVKSFHAATGHTVVLTFGTVGNIQERLAAGEAADLVIVTKEAVDELERTERTVRKARMDLGRVGIGVAVKAGAPRPDISSAEAFKQTLLAAKSLVAVDPAKGGTSGIHFAKLLEQLGIADQVHDKLLLLPGGNVVEKVADGEAELGVQQISEILPVAGVQLVGPLPSELQKVTTYTAAIVMHTAIAPAAASLLRYLGSPSIHPRFVAAGFNSSD